jgi:alpha-amylase
MDKSKLFCGAVLNILLPGIPSIYYGQELGVTGKIGNWGYDVNHIPVREAFPWTPDPNEPGTALFYKDTGPWWDQSYFNTGEAKKLALSVQKKDPSSLWNFYRRLILFRQSSVAVRTGDFKRIQTGKPFVLAFSRETRNEKVVVMLNLSANSLTMKSLSAKKYDFIENTEIQGDSIVFQPYGIVVCKE